MAGPGPHLGVAVVKAVARHFFPSMAGLDLGVVSQVFKIKGNEVAGERQVAREEDHLVYQTPPAVFRLESGLDGKTWGLTQGWGHMGWVGT